MLHAAIHPARLLTWLRARIHYRRLFTVSEDGCESPDGGSSLECESGVSTPSISATRSEDSQLFQRSVSCGRVLIRSACWRRRHKLRPEIFSPVLAPVFRRRKKNPQFLVSASLRELNGCRDINAMETKTGTDTGTQLMAQTY